MKFSENLLAYTWTGIFSCFVIILIGPHNKANVALDRSIGKSARRSAEREDAGSNPGRTNTQGLQITLDRRKCCLCKEICKRLDFQIFWDKDGKPKARLTTLAKLNSDEIEKKKRTVRIKSKVPSVLFYVSWGEWLSRARSNWRHALWRLPCQELANLNNLIVLSSFTHS